jgi:acyl-coenzyme A synthetase/AMP-(fatty) acid ligase
MATVREMAESALGRDPAVPLIEFEHQWTTIGQMRAIADAMNAAIDESGCDPRAPIALIPRNRPAPLAAMLGLAMRERHVRMIHPYQSPSGLARDVARLRPAVVVALAQDFTAEVLGVLRERGTAGIALDGLEVRTAPGCERSTAEHDVPAAEPIFDLLTSGTTGPPKQFPITYDFIAREMVGANTMAFDPGAPDPLGLPPAHLYWPFGNFSGLYATLTPMLMGLRGVLADRFQVAQFHDYLVRFKPDVVGLPPAGVQMILDADIPVEDFACVKVARVGSAPLTLASHRAFEDRYGIPILQAYGATEFGGPVAAMPLEAYPKWGRKKLGSVGLPFGDCKVRVIDPESGALLPAGSEGLLEVLAPRMGPDWMRTTDLGMLDADGFLWHRGRADGAIMRGGFKLLPEAIEEALVTHPAIGAAMVAGVPDHRLGQVPAAAMVLKPGAAIPDLDELRRHLRERIEATHIPVHWRFLESLPYNAMMKPDRATLRRHFEAEYEIRETT